MNDPVLSVEEVKSFLEDVFPQINGRVVPTKIEPMRASAIMPFNTEDVRPGGTISGPAMFMLADCAFYIVTLAMIGREALTVTTNCTINFMRKPAPADMRAEARILKLGRSLSVGDVTLFSRRGHRSCCPCQSDVFHPAPPLDHHNKRVESEV